MSTPLIILEQGLLAFLKGNAAITALATSGGIYLNAAPEKSPDPCMAFTRISSIPDATMDGPSGLNFRRYQFTFYSTDYTKALQLSETVRLAIDGYQGYLPNGQRVYNIIRDNELDGFDDVTSWHHCITDYFIHFAE